MPTSRSSSLFAVKLARLFIAALGLFAGSVAWGQFAYNPNDPMGENALFALDPTLTGTGITVAVPESDSNNGNGNDAFEINPANGGLNGSPTQVTYISYAGTATTFPNSVGTESGHADAVSQNLHKMAPGLSQILNYDADYYNDQLDNATFYGEPFIGAEIVNQSWSFSNDSGEQAGLDETFDLYASEFNTLFISAAGDGGGISSPASMYNGIAVGAYGGGSSTGPTYGGRSKPDITAPANETSFSAPEVSGAAAVLLEAAQRGDAGPGTETDASDARVLKALLLNGTTKPTGWSNTPTAPLNETYGAGILNVYNSYLNLEAGQYSATGSCAGSLHSQSSSSVLPDEGWNLATITNIKPILYYEGQADYYQFDLSASVASSFTLSSTLIWWLQANQTQINNLYLYLYDSDTGTQIALSDSTVDNVQYLYVTGISPGDYDLVVYKAGGLFTSAGGNMVSASETYALAFNFAPDTGDAPAAITISSVPEPSVFFLLAGAIPFYRRFRRGGK